MSFPKNIPARNPLYLEWVRGLPSCISGKFPCIAHHIKGHGLGGSTKSSDYFAIPLTHEEHMDLHAHGIYTWETQYGSQLEHSAKTLERWMREHDDI